MRGLIVLVVAVGTGLGWWVRTARVQREPVTAIERAGGHVAYESPLVKGQFFPEYVPFWSRWIVVGLGIDYFGHPVRVRLPAKNTDQIMVHVRRLPANLPIRGKLWVDDFHIVKKPA